MLDVTFVAEHHESLRHVRLFVSVSNIPAGATLIPEVHEDGTSVTLRLGNIRSLPLALPTRVTPETPDVRWTGTYYELRLNTPLPLSPDASGLTISSSSTSAPQPSPLIDASSLESTLPTSFACASCSLPLAQGGARIANYRDLPSEHWAELLDAWMCHTDQTLHAHASERAARGFEPTLGTVLVGGSYLLFHQENVVGNNIVEVETKVCLASVTLLPLLWISSADKKKASVGSATGGDH
jgi:ubiquitin-protein ligase E3 D